MKAGRTWRLNMYGKILLLCTSSILASLSLLASLFFYHSAETIYEQSKQSNVIQLQRLQDDVTQFVQEVEDHLISVYNDSDLINDLVAHVDFSTLKETAVFRLTHCDAEGVESALKIVSLMEEFGSLAKLSPARLSDYRSVLEKSKVQATQEVLLMSTLRSRTNTVEYLDHTFVEWEENGCFGCDMLIRMELLQDLRREINRRDPAVLSQREIIKIGKDICQALILCHSKRILHRDIKPENIFFNQDGNYKLGDFGISRILSAAANSQASTGIGTPQYWAPEQMSGRYDQRVDIYSLGLVLYELCNGNRLPFAASSYVTDEEILLRLQGVRLPPPRKPVPDAV